MSRVLRVLGFLGGCTCTVVPARCQAPATQAAGQTTGQAATAPTPDNLKRDELLKPGLDALRKGDGAAALEALKPALEAYPNDVRVLSFSAQAAMEAHQDEAALGFFERALIQNPPDPWHMRVAMILLEARLARWADFDRDQAALKAAKKSGERELASMPGFLIDEFDVDGKSVKVAYFPTLVGKFNTLYRFVLPELPRARSATPAQGPDSDRCKDPQFRPYIDVESDDVDQSAFKEKHPDLATKGERSYSLDTYPAPCSQGLIKFYFYGEPTYETVRADVVKNLTAKPATAKPTPPNP